MKIICHRGHWINHSDQNSLESIKRSFKFDGAEIDIRSLNGKLILSHDPILAGRKYTSLEDAFRLKTAKDFFWALNIKEDGLGPALLKHIKKYKIKNYMCFDLSFPEMVSFEKLRLKTFTRTGDREPEIQSKNLVFDCFKSRNFAASLRRVPSSSRVMVISPELHAEKYLIGWKKLRQYSFKECYLCTDFPAEAKEYFRD